MPSIQFQGSALRSARRAAKLSQHDLAVKLTNAGHKVTGPGIHLWEIGKHEPRGSVVLQLARILRRKAESFYTSAA